MSIATMDMNFRKAMIPKSPDDKKHLESNI